MSGDLAQQSGSLGLVDLSVLYARQAVSSPQEPGRGTASTRRSSRVCFPKCTNPREEFSEAYDKYAKNFPNGSDDGHTWDHYAVHGKVECLTHARRRGVRRTRLRTGDPNSLCIVAATKMKKQLDGQIELETIEDAIHWLEAQEWKIVA